jgi:ribonuclease Z
MKIRCIASLLLYSSLLVAYPTSAQDITVTLLGTGSPEPAMDRFGPSTLVQAGTQTLIFDVGRGVNQRLAQVGLNVQRIDAIFLTHLHSDHVVGIPDLWLTGWLRTASNRPLNVWGPSGTTQMMERLRQAFEADIRDRGESEPDLPRGGSEFAAADIQAGVVYEKQGVRVTALRVEHTGVSPAFSYRVEYQGRVVVLSGDTRFSPELIRFAAGANVLIHEVYDASDEYLKQNPRTVRVRTFHASGKEAGEVFQRVRPQLAVYSHIVLRGLTVSDLVTRTRVSYSGPLVVGEDLLRVVIADSVTILRP